MIATDLKDGMTVILPNYTPEKWVISHVVRRVGTRSGVVSFRALPGNVPTPHYVKGYPERLDMEVRATSEIEVVER